MTSCQSDQPEIAMSRDVNELQRLVGGAEERMSLDLAHGVTGMDHWEAMQMSTLNGSTSKPDLVTWDRREPQTMTSCQSRPESTEKDTQR